VIPEARTAELEELAAEIEICSRCRLHEQRRHAVPGEGSAETEVVFVGEGPGQHEDEQGRPFVGAAGGLLTELLRSIGWRREDVFITNIVKCRPPGNRDPEPDEIAACAPFLRRQLELLEPAVVVTLGRFSLGTFMPGARIGAVHGTSRRADPAAGALDAAAFALYHPAAAFRQQSLRTSLFEDISHLPEVLIERRAARRAAGAAAAAIEDDMSADLGSEQSPGPDPEPGAEASPVLVPDDQMKLF
jgi:DNA polymerase